ncbi:type II toxin-antitoxin system RelE/ParE family toxin [Candidatus Kaiserbacteria bacterium]|nr:type II toxin-antitoxin system RelE/ParE family toxin [Candidatus Kaiserbacteria bacterium]
MAWRAELSDTAERQLVKLPKDARRRIGLAIDILEVDPFQGNTIPLKGRLWHGRYRKRVGRYRIIFVLYPETHIVKISAILLRDEKTYR